MRSDSRGTEVAGERTQLNRAPTLRVAQKLSAMACRHRTRCTMRWHRLASLLAVVAVIGTACGGGGSKTSEGTGPQEKVTLDYWGTKEGYDDYSAALVKAFEAKYPNIHIKVTTYPEANYQTKIDTALAAGKPPDLGAVGVFYNKAMFKAAGIPNPAPWPPMTIDQFVDTACKLTNKAKGVWGGAYGYPETLLPWETEFSKDGRTAVGIVNGPTAVHAYDVMARGIRQGCAPSLNTMDPWEQGADFFSQGKLAMVVTDLQSFKKIENAKIDYGVTHPPTAQGVEPFLQTWTDVTGVFAGTKHQKEAELFIAFQTTEGQRLRVQVTGDMPISTAVAKETNWAHGILGREEALEVVPHARPAVFIPNRWDTVGALDEAYDQIVGGKSAQQVLNDAAPKVQSDLDKAWRDWDKDKG